MSLIQVQNLSFSYEGSSEPVFDRVSFHLDTRWRLGVTGRNGKGKTTFLKLLSGELDHNGAIQTQAVCDYFPFPVPHPELETWQVLDLVTDGEAQLWEIQRELSKLQAEEEILYRPFQTLSKGEQTKALLAALFLRQGHFLLIDEPTNHLDQEARKAVSRYLSSREGFLLVSHDRAFLDGCVDHILALNRQDIEIQQGNFSSWYENRKRRDAFEEAENNRLKKDIRRLEEGARQSGRWADQAEASKIGRNPKKEETFIGTRSYLGEKSRRMQQQRKNMAAPSGTGCSGEKRTSEKCRDSGQSEAVSAFLSQPAACSSGSGFRLLWKSAGSCQRAGDCGNQKRGENLSPGEKRMWKIKSFPADSGRADRGGGTDMEGLRAENFLCFAGYFPSAGKSERVCQSVSGGGAFDLYPA